MEAVRHEINLPMPRCRCSKLHMTSKWNLMKLSSNTMTTIVDSTNIGFPANGSQGLAISRILKCCAYDLMKMFQACTLKKDIEDFSSVQVWRNSASHRMQCPKCIKNDSCDI